MANDTKFLELLRNNNVEAIDALDAADGLASTDDQKLLRHLAAAVCIELANIREAFRGIEDQLAYIRDKLPQPD